MWTRNLISTVYENCGGYRMASLVTINFSLPIIAFVFLNEGKVVMDKVIRWSIVAVLF